MSLFLRHILWTTLCPGTVTIFLPLLILSRDIVFKSPLQLLQWFAAALILIGAVILISCIVMFGKFGKGTLSPFDPARHLVIQGLYRYVRNPMYVGVMIMLIGETLLFDSQLLLFYTAIVFIGFNVFVVFYEEPFLRKEFGPPYDHYRRHVGRWIPGRPYQEQEKQ